jgi:hypothetical protein
VCAPEKHALAMSVKRRCRETDHGSPASLPRKQLVKLTWGGCFGTIMHRLVPSTLFNHQPINPAASIAVATSCTVLHVTAPPSPCSTQPSASPSCIDNTTRQPDPTHTHTMHLALHLPHHRLCCMNLTACELTASQAQQCPSWPCLPASQPPTQRPP